MTSSHAAAATAAVPTSSPKRYFSVPRHLRPSQRSTAGYTTESSTGTIVMIAMQSAAFSIDALICSKSALNSDNRLLVNEMKFLVCVVT